MIKNKSNLFIIFINILLLSVIIIIWQIKIIDEKIPESILSSEHTFQTAQNDMESFARTEARYMAKWIWECIKSWIENWYPLLTTIYNCWANHRSWWESWDFFVFDRIAKKMIYDWSPDCLKWWISRSFDNEFEKIFTGTNQWECYMHHNREQCISAINDLYNIWDTDNNSNIWWQFDDSPEWLESYVIPEVRKWFNWIIWNNWIKTWNNMQLQIVMWTQKDEVYKNFKNTILEYKKTLDEKINLLKQLILYVRIIVILMIIMAFLNVIILKYNQE